MFPKWIDQIPAIYQITQAFYQFHFIAKICGQKSMNNAESGS